MAQKKWHRIISVIAAYEKQNLTVSSDGTAVFTLKPQTVIYFSKKEEHV